eukprot:m.175742 g.175742  ORF g.175742 m.175742 type:complete len:298 (+) comp39131_c2_seq37:1251-2144(+)
MDRCYQFNNSALFAPEEERSMFTEIYWKLCQKGAEAFLGAIFATTPFSLKLTKEVLRERQRIHAQMARLRASIDINLSMMTSIKNEKAKVESDRSVIDEMKNYTYDETKKAFRERPLRSGEYTTTCPRCSWTCHYPCGIPDNADKARCSAMCSDGYCYVCPSKCKWDLHFNAPYQFEWYTDTKTVTIKEKKTQHDQAKTRVTTSERALAHLEGKLQVAKDEIKTCTDAARGALNRLSEIALLKMNYSYGQYVELLMQNERDARKDGWEERIETLRRLKEEHEALEKIEKGESIVGSQ